jgi:hypothetical protein
MNRSLITLTSLLTLITSFQAFSFQNVNELLANPDITWVGEVYVDYLPNVNLTDPENPQIKDRHETMDYNAIDILKVQRHLSDHQLGSIPDLLSQKIFHLNSETLNIYKEADLKEKLSNEAYQKIIHQEVSKIHMYSDPETYEQIIDVIKSELDASHIEQFRLKQVLSYNVKTNQLNITPIAIAPLQSINKFIAREEVPLFWMPIKEAFKTIDLDNASIDWAKRFDKGLFSDSIKTLKGTQDLSNVFMEMIAGYRANSSATKMYQIEGDNKQLVALKPEAIKKLGIEEDIVVSFDPETFEEIIQVVDNSPTAKHFQKIRITQDWVWDNKTQVMQIRVVAFSLITYRPDQNGNYFYAPYYYIKARE